MKDYTIIFADYQGNELQRIVRTLSNDCDAYAFCQALLAETMINDCMYVYFLD